MSIVRRSLKGLIYYDPTKVYNGYTLFTPLGSKETVLVDMQGEIIHRWKMPYPPALYGVLLENGNLLYSGHIAEGPLADLEGAGGELLEVDWNGNVLWSYKDPYMHHSFYRMPNGNTMILRWVQVPKEIAIKLKGGIAGTEKDGIIWSDSLREINPRGKIVWEWFAHEHLDPEKDTICPLCPRTRWAGANSFSVFTDGNIVVSFAQINALCIINKNNGNIEWRWGYEGELGHQNDVTVLENGNILVFDNGTHCSISFSQGYSRVLEINPNTNEMVWEYKDNPWMAFYSAYMSSCQRLPNENTLICEAATGRIFEVTKRGEIVWEFINPFPYSFDPVYGHNRIIPKAFRYAPEDEELEGKELK